MKPFPFQQPYRPPRQPPSAAACADAAPFGHYAWRASSGSATITAEHAALASIAAQSDLAGGLYAGRWHDASRKQREYLAAMAVLLVAEGSATRADISRRLPGTGTWILETIARD